MLKFCYSGRTEGDARKGVRVGGTLVVREMGRRGLGLYLLGYKRRYVQSIIGASQRPLSDPKRTLLKRLESCLSRSGFELLRYLRQSMNDIRNHLFGTVHPVNP